MRAQNGRAAALLVAGAFFMEFLDGTIISTAGTVSNRSRGGRPSSLNIIDIGEAEIAVTTHIWTPRTGCFEPGPQRSFAR